MEKAIKSSLSFNGFKIAKSKFEIKEGKRPSELDISFGLSGEVIKAKNYFKLYFDTKISDKNDLIQIKVTAVGDFKIDASQLDETGYKNFIFLNSPAILFPYVRAYITSLTSLSGINPIQIPIMNVTNLKEVLEKNLSYIDSETEKE